MRNRFGLLTAALLVASPLAAQQPAPQPVPQPGSVDIGFRATSIEGDAARAQHFRDLGSGVLLDRFRLQRNGSGWVFAASADRVGWRDQRYQAELVAHGKVKMLFLWDQVPLFISGDTRTLYSTSRPGEYRLAGTFRQSIQDGTLKIGDVVGGASPVELSSRRDTAQFRFIYTPVRDVDVKVNVRSARREGSMPMAASFGFSNAVELPAPIDTRSTDMNAGVEWANARGMLRIGYDASWFTNHIETLTWDNPLRATDIATAGSQGRYSLPPSSTMTGISTAASIKLPARSRLTGNVSVGRWNQDQELLPFTINSASVSAAASLPRPTADAKANTLAMNYNFTSRPNRLLWFNARYRYYDFDNRTAPFSASPGMVVMDQNVGTGHTSEPISSTRHNIDLDASFTPAPFTAIRVGYGREEVDRTFRIFEATTDNVFRTSIDATSFGWLTVRAIVEHAVRRGSGFELGALTEANEQPTMRHYDVADRNRDRVTGLVQVTPVPAVGFSISAARGKDDYNGTGFGLRNNENRVYTVTADFVPHEAVSAGLSYSFEKYAALQTSRSANAAQFNDPTRDWSDDSADKAHNVVASLDLMKLAPKTDLRFAYNFNRSRTTFRYTLAPNSPLVAPSQLPPVTNELQRATADARYFLTPRVAIGFVYAYDRYSVNDFSMDPATISRLDMPGTLMLGYVYRPYAAHTGWLRLTYLW
ncbi:MAG: hypothetical protein A3H96_18760 [Acidobacteria bacterium RIFCSPLOWO2_02_FULL_67_36]|nr:MAG: hypothetical protein A3H96_18760 [Acidobacteria bacterium RIFCSPLOWO2_02_FULL_67_36]OFW18929.1 MAG: hypothetical protein A3G21_04250 [Acidobacteria bacterium RIFCSPLOWO2_12_FULL_66_21]